MISLSQSKKNMQIWQEDGRKWDINLSSRCQKVNEAKDSSYAKSSDELRH